MSVVPRATEAANWRSIFLKGIVVFTIRRRGAGYSTELPTRLERIWVDTEAANWNEWRSGG